MHFIVTSVIDYNLIVTLFTFQISQVSSDTILLNT